MRSVSATSFRFGFLEGFWVTNLCLAVSEVQVAAANCWGSSQGGRRGRWQVVGDSETEASAMGLWWAAAPPAIL
jgi:hypothetical protein